MKKKSKAIIIYNLDKTVYGEFPSIVEAAKNLKCGKKTIRRALSGETKLKKKKVDCGAFFYQKKKESI